MPDVIRSVEDVRQRATVLSNNRSSLVQRQTELETRIDKYWEKEWTVETASEIEDAVEVLEEELDNVNDELAWTEPTLEALEWVLCETDVKPEEVEEAEHAHSQDGTGDPQQDRDIQTQAD